MIQTSSSEISYFTSKKAKETCATKALRKLTEVTIFDPVIPVVQMVTGSKNENKVSYKIQIFGSKYNLLYNAMLNDITNLGKGYACLELFHKAEYKAKRKGKPACIETYCIEDIKFIIRKPFNKIPPKSIITPRRFASIVTLAADRVFREKLLSDPSAMKTAFETIRNPFGKVHGFSVNCIPETKEQKKLFYYYLVTTIGWDTLMEINLISCMALAKWRLEDDNIKRLGLGNKANDINETFASCVPRITATTKYLINTKKSCFCFTLDDIIDDEKVMGTIMSEFSFLKQHARKHFSKLFPK